MTVILREPEKAASTRFDLIVVGGGIQGACLVLEAAIRGLRPLLLERNDFGGDASWSSLRIAHGGLRHLQRLDFGAAYRSAREQAWWLRNFPDLVEPLACLLPVYNRGTRRLALLRAALWMQRTLSRTSTESLSPGSLPAGRILSVAETLERFPDAERSGLRGGALWYDGRFAHPQRLLIEILRWAVAGGAQVLNYVECDDVIAERGQVVGVTARCREEQRSYRFFANAVVNTASTRAFGPLGVDAQRGGPGGSVWAFNVVLQRPPLSADAVAITPRRRAAPSYFALPEADRSVLGTAYLPDPQDGYARVGEAEVAAFLSDVNAALPGFNASTSEVLEVRAGRLPATGAGAARPASRARIIDHEQHFGVRGVLSVENVKFTDARWVAERVLRRLFGGNGDSPLSSDPVVPRPLAIPRCDPTLGSYKGSGLASWMATESALHIDDLLLRRFDCDRDPKRLTAHAEELMAALPWGPTRRKEERKRLEEALRSLAGPAATSATDAAEPSESGGGAATGAMDDADPIRADWERDAAPDVISSTDDYARRFSGPVGAYFLSTQLESVLRWMPAAQGCRVLDIGGGHAQLAAPLVRRGYDVTVFGSEHSSRERLDRMIGRDRYRFQRGSLLDLPFEPKSFDVVLAFRMLPHLGDWQRLIEEACRVSAGAVVLDYPERPAQRQLSRPALLRSEEGCRTGHPKLRDLPGS